MRNVSSKRCRENQNTNFMSNNFLSKFRAAYEIMSKNVVKPQRPQVTIWRLVACWISNVTHAKEHARTHMHTLTEICNTYCFSPVRMVSWTRFVVPLHVHCLSCSYICVLHAEYLDTYCGLEECTDAIFMLYSFFEIMIVKFWCQF